MGLESESWQEEQCGGWAEITGSQENGKMDGLEVKDGWVEGREKKKRAEQH